MVAPPAAAEEDGCPVPPNNHSIFTHGDFSMGVFCTKMHKEMI
jgi:hypothetical protein